ncbi:MAG TPA: sensor histidine kinase [Pyrinomonadaceae bacterium]|nr:sensor histidine kinase [Pyrinomonadaceae bacterium]
MQIFRISLGLLIVLVLCGCAANRTNRANHPSIELTLIPREDKGGIEEIGVIGGRVTGARSDQHIVLYARSGAWYVQPWADQPFTKINSDSTWSNSTHLGTEYAALLVEPGYVPPAFTHVLPNEGSGVVAIVVVEGTPPFWRTWWFRVLMVLVGAFLLFVLYRYHLHRVRTQLNLRFEERLAERTRIAQDLHDTLLQGVISASMQLHVANAQLADDAPAKPIVGRVMELMGQVVDEGRDAVRGLRSTAENTDNLETSFSQVGKQLATNGPRDYRVIVEGTQRQLRPIIRDEVYRIGREALVNAFRHSQAGKIEVELEYSPKHLRVLVRDDGAGIDPNVLQSGRDGHWGLAGMRERAESIGARLRVFSRARAGTEVELSIPGHIAFVSTPSGPVGKWFDKLRRGASTQENDK